ncbi:MAG: flippase [Ignavibacteriales bacterium]|nr:flippase [Ignavibacteriales bacterium]
MVSSPAEPSRFESASVLRNSVLLFGFHVFTKSLAFISFILLAKYLGTQLFGVYNYAFALTALFIPLCDLGMDTYLMREIPRLTEADIPKQLGAVLSWKGLLTFLVCLVMSLTTGLLDTFGSERFFMVVLAGLITLLRTYWTTFASFFRAINRVGYETGLLSLARVAEFVVIVVSISTDNGLLTLLAVLTLVNIVFVSLTHVLVRRRFTRPIMVGDFAHMISMLRGGLPFALATIFSAIYFNFDTVLLSKFIGDEAAGVYRAAYNLIFPLTMFGLAITGAVFPFASQNYRDRPGEVESVVQRSIVQLLLIALPIAIITTLLSREIVRFLFAPEFAATAECLSILVWFLPVVFLTNFYSNTLGAIDEQTFVLKVTILSALFNIIANLVVIPMYGQVGASINTVLTALIGFGFLVVKMRKKIVSRLPLSTILRILAASSFVLPLLIIKPNLHVLVLLGASVVTYSFALLLFRAVTISDLKTLFLSLRSQSKF